MSIKQPPTPGERHDDQAASCPSEAVDDGPTLRKSAIGLRESTIISMAGAAPGQVVAVSLAPLIVASSYGFIPSIIVASIAMLCIAVAFQRMNLWEQDCGGPYAWVGRAVGPGAGFGVGWILVVTFVVSLVINFVSIGPAVLALFGFDPSSQWGTVVAATVLGAFLTAFAVIGVQLTGRLQLSLAIAEYAVLLLFSALAFWALFADDRPGSVHPAWAWLSPSGVGGTGGFVAAMLLVIFMIAQWDTSIYLSEETERAETNPGKAVIIAVIVLGIMYTLICFAFATVAPPEAMEQHSTNAAVFVAEELTGTNWAKAMALAVVASVLAATQATIVGLARIMLAMGRDKVLPSVFGKVHRKFRTPAAGTLLIGGLGIAATWVYILASSVAHALDLLIATVGFLFACYYALTALAAAWALRDRVLSNWRDALLGGVLPLVGAALLGWVAIACAIDFTAAEWGALAVLSALGVVMYLVAKYRYRAPILRSPK
ncbi:APC family permease [Mycolicibacterium brisbanense]